MCRTAAIVVRFLDTGGEVPYDSRVRIGLSKQR